MKTPMQELIFVIRKRQEDEDVQPFMWLEQIVELAESMLEKEKEVITSTYNQGQKDMVDIERGGMPNFLTFEEYYNTTFNTKEK